MDLLGDVTRKLDEIRSIQTGNQQELVALKAKLGHLHVGRSTRYLKASPFNILHLTAECHRGRRLYHFSEEIAIKLERLGAIRTHRTRSGS
jgi:hypothetical protein